MSSLPATPDVPPALPNQPPDRFQFSLKQLLAFMFASAFVAMGLRLLLQWIDRLPDGFLGTWLGVLSSSLALGMVAYFVLRGPFLVWHAVRLNRRWDTVKSHRRELTEWAKARRSETKPRPVVAESGTMDQTDERSV